MIRKGTPLYSILNFRCPYCHEGEFFLAHPYNLKRVGVWVAFLVLAPEVDPIWIVALAGGVMLLAGPYLYALSRIIWANMFLDFENPTGARREDA